MAKLAWDAAGTHYFTTGCSHGVLYPQSSGAYPKGVAWSGLSKVSRSPSGGDVSKYYADDTKYLGIRGVEEFGGTIEAYYYPNEFASCNGEGDLMGGQTFSGVMVTGQTRTAFGFSYQSRKGNDTVGTSYGTIYHLVYGCTCSPSSSDDSSMQENVEPGTMSWEFDTTPVTVTGFKPTSHIEIDGSLLTAAQITALENALYGTDGQGSGTGTDPYLPLPDALKTLIESAT